jgi:hypothetical protein
VCVCVCVCASKGTFNMFSKIMTKDEFVTAIFK